MIVSDDRVVRFAETRLGWNFVPPYSCIGIEQDGEIVAAAVFNQFESRDIRLTAVGAGWSRRFLMEVGRYVFGYLDCLRMTAVTEQDEVIRLALRIGGQVEGRLRNHYGYGRDGILIGFLKEEWRYGV